MQDSRCFLELQELPDLLTEWSVLLRVARGPQNEDSTALRGSKWRGFPTPKRNQEDRISSNQDNENCSDKTPS